MGLTLSVPLEYILSAIPPPAAQTRQRHSGEGEVHPNVEYKLESGGTLHQKI